MLRDLESTILKVRPDVFFVRSDDGVWLRNNVGSLFIKGAQSYELVRSLLTRLDGTRPVHEILGRADPKQRAVLHERLLEPLLRNGFISEVRAPVEPVPPWMIERYGEQLAFLEQYVDNPPERLLQIRSRRVVCLGSGLLLRAMAVSLADLGFARVRLLAADDAADSALLSGLVEAARRADGYAEWSVMLHPPATPIGALASACGETGAAGVVIAAEGVGFMEMAATVAELRARGQTVAVIAATGGLVVASPLMSDEEWCWECLYRSVVGDGSATPAPPSAALAAFQVAQRFFCRFAGPPVPEDRRITTVDCRTLTLRSHTPHRHPGCGAHRPVPIVPRPLAPAEYDDSIIRPDIATSRDADEQVAVQNRIVESMAAWTDPVAGPFVTVGEEDLPQLPLSASRCRIRASGSLPEAPEVHTLECRAIASREARNQVVLLGLEFIMETHTGQVGSQGDILALGAGWSMGEAVYRAWAAASLQCLPADGPANRRFEGHQLGVAPTRAFLLHALADVGIARVELWLNDLTTGLVAARVVAGCDVLGRGVGIDDGHAVDHALADAVGRCTAPASAIPVATAHPAPPEPNWSAVLHRIRDRGRERWAVADMGSLLPFLHDRAYLVALVADEGIPSGRAE